MFQYAALEAKILSASLKLLTQVYPEKYYPLEVIGRVSHDAKLDSSVTGSVNGV